jgi:hypothetical protein
LKLCSVFRAKREQTFEGMPDYTSNRYDTVVAEKSPRASKQSIQQRKQSPQQRKAKRSAGFDD